MTRTEMLAELDRRLNRYSDGGLAAILAREPEWCRLCSGRAIRRDCWVDADGRPFVRLACSRRRQGCPWTRTIDDPDPPPGPRRPRRKNGCRPSTPLSPCRARG